MSKLFKPGDLIRKDNVEYIVIQNYGCNGLVKENCDNGVMIKGFSWNQNGEDVEFIENTSKDINEIENIQNEYERFFEKLG